MQEIVYCLADCIQCARLILYTICQAAFVYNPPGTKKEPRFRPRLFCVLFFYFILRMWMIRQIQLNWKLFLPLPKNWKLLHQTLLNWKQMRPRPHRNH